jgi:hypothetical protein
MVKIPEIRSGELPPELGPAMRSLPTAWQRAALAIFETNGNRSDALRKAGFKFKTPHSCQAYASRLFLDPRMRAAVSELMAYMLESIEPELFGAVLQIMRDNKGDAKDKLRAAAMIWDRARPIKTMHQVHVEHHLTTDEIDMAHYRALKKLNAPHSTFLERFGTNGLPRVEAMVAVDDAKVRQVTDQSGSVIETQFEEVSDDQQE